MTDRESIETGTTGGIGDMADQIHPLVEERMYVGGTLRSAEGGKVFDNVESGHRTGDWRVRRRQWSGYGRCHSGGKGGLRRRVLGGATTTVGPVASANFMPPSNVMRLRSRRPSGPRSARRRAPCMASSSTRRSNTCSTQQIWWNVTNGRKISARLEFLGIPTRRTLRREAAGVAACITPWNAPMQVNLAKLSAALGAGCTAILKPAPDTPWSATALGRLAAEETDMPAGVLNVVPTSDNSVAQRLAEDPRVDVVSFTGSTVVGRHLMAVAAPTVKNVFLELGGKSACIVCDDAPLDEVAMSTAFGSSAQAGQGCSINTRLLVQRGVYEQMVEKVSRTAFRSVVYGDPADPAVYMGPLISRRQRERVLSYIELGQSEGARLVTGGRRPVAMKSGYFVSRRSFADVDPGVAAGPGGDLGPVLCIIPFETDTEAVQIANGTIYGLAAQVESRVARTSRSHIAHRLRAGNVNVNGGLYHAPDSPFGGYKQSGIGRKMGVLGFDEYTEVKLLAYGQR